MSNLNCVLIKFNQIIFRIGIINLSLKIHVFISVPDLANTLELNEEDFKNKFGISKPQKDQKIGSHCMMGGRAGKAADALKELGFTNATSYTGSFKDWKAKGGPIEGGMS